MLQELSNGIPIPHQLFQPLDGMLTTSVYNGTLIKNTLT